MTSSILIESVTEDIKEALEDGYSEILNYSAEEMADDLIQYSYYAGWHRDHVVAAVREVRLWK